MNPANGVTPGTSTAHGPYPRVSNWGRMRSRTSRSDSARVITAGKNSMTRGSAFIAANGSRSASRHSRSTRRSVRSSVTPPA